MKLSLIVDALRHYSLTNDSADYTDNEIFDALDECAQQKDAFTNESIYGDIVRLISPHALLELLNYTTYDILGKAIKIHGSESRYLKENYVINVRDKCDVDLSKEALLEAFYPLYDLWHDNEENDAHNPDGTFKTAADKIKEDAKEAIKSVDDALLIIETNDDIGPESYMKLNNILETIKEKLEVL